MKSRRTIILLFAVPVLSLHTGAQSLAESGASSGTVAITTPMYPALAYIRPTAEMKLHSYLFDVLGPNPIAGATLAAGISQADDAPPEWKQGVAGYSKRLGSDFGINAVTITTRFALAQALHEDALYYRCQCKGVFPRFRHAMISTFTGRRGADGHRVFSISALVAPYAGTMTAVYGWYPSRYNDKDAFRMGNYSLLGYVAENVALEFFYSGPHSLLHRMHLNNGRGAPDPSPAP
jgi:hypothetical protein